jgi:hypothetical protein
LQLPSVPHWLLLPGMQTIKQKVSSKAALLDVPGSGAH